MNRFDHDDADRRGLRWVFSADSYNHVGEPCSWWDAGSDSPVSGHVCYVDRDEEGFPCGALLVEGALQVEIDLAAAAATSEAAIAAAMEAEEEVCRLDLVPHAVAEQLSEQLPGINIQGADDRMLVVCEVDEEGGILPPSTAGRAAFEAVVKALNGTGFGVRYDAVNGTWNHREACEPLC